MDKGVMSRLLSYIKPYIKYLFIALFAAIASITCSLLVPVLVGKGIDHMIAKGEVDFSKIAKIIVVLILIILISSVFQWIMSLCTNIITYNTIRDIRREAFEKLHRVPLRYIDSTAHGEIISRIANDVEQISDGLLQGITQIFTGVVTILGTLIFMLITNAAIAVVVVVLTPLSLFVAAFIAKRSRKYFTQQAQLQGEITGYVEEIVGNQKVVTTFSYEEEAQQRFEEINSKLKVVGVQAQFSSALTNPCTRFVNGVVYAAVGIIGAISAINLRLSIGQLSCFLTYANQYTKPFNEVTTVITQLQTAIASARRVFEVIDEENEQPDAENAITMTATKGNVSLENVSFSYNSSVSLIQNVNLNVKSGNKVAIVGPTGCGKTTIINLLMRFYDVNNGVIKIDGIDIRNITRESLRNMYGMVLQETWLFKGTVRDNIAYGKPEATMEMIIEAAKAAHAHSFIKRMPNGYDTIMEEGGSNISVGQKQLLCIARVMLEMPPMLILDEATSSIDTRTEHRIQRAFNRLMEGKTSFIVAHRLSTIKEADIILVMKDGNIIEQGSHTALLDKGGFYHKLYNSQFAES